MPPHKNDLKKLKRNLIIGQTIVFLGAIVALFCSMALNHRDKILHVLISRLDVTTEAMAGQLKANKVPAAAGTSGQGVFIINQNDGTMVINRQDPTDADKQLWGSYQNKLIYEMQKQKRGWIVYPDKNVWDLNQKQKIIRYVSLDELNWILAIEVPRPTEFELLEEVLQPGICFTLIAIVLIGAALLWFMTSGYFNMIKRHATDTVENNLMSLSGEEKVWNKFVSNQEDLSKEALGLGQGPKLAAAPAPKEFLDPHIPVPKTAQAPVEIETKVQAPIKKVEASPDTTSVDQGSININSITNPALKKMLQQFRNQ